MSKELDIIRIQVSSIRASIDRLKMEEIDDNRALTIGTLVELINAVNGKVKSLENYLKD